MIVASFPRSNPNVRALVQGLVRHQLLESFHTTLQSEINPLLRRMLPSSVSESLRKRTFGIDRRLVNAYPFREMVRLLAPRLKLDFLANSESAFASVDATCMALDNIVAEYIARPGKRDSISGVYCYEDSALETFRAANSLGKRTFYELTIPYWQAAHRVLREAAAMRPEWACTIPAMTDSQDKLQRKTEELERADVVLCISDAVRRSLPPEILLQKQVEVVRYGVPDLPPEKDKQPRVRNKRLRVLFVGSMTQRKGLADLFDAMNMLKRDDIELIVLGAPLVSMDFYRQHCNRFTYHPPANNAQILDLMRGCDVFAFPSLLEGRGLVQLEAMRCGLPLITTENATGDELVEHGYTGFIVPPHDPEKIAACLSLFADDREKTREMGQRAKVAALEWQWRAYEDHVAKVILTSL